MKAKRQKAANDLHPFVRLHVHSHYGVGAADRNYCVSEFEKVDYIISEGGGSDHGCTDSIQGWVY